MMINHVDLRELAVGECKDLSRFRRIDVRLASAKAKPNIRKLDYEYTNKSTDCCAVALGVLSVPAVAADATTSMKTLPSRLR